MIGRVIRAGQAHADAGRLGICLLAGSALAGLPASAAAQSGAAAAARPAPGAAVQGPAAQASPAPSGAAPQSVLAGDPVRTISVVGAQRLEPQTIVSYIRLRPGDTFTQAAGDEVLKDLYATDLFANVAVRNGGGAVTIEVQENPVINRIILEGNKRLKEDKILPEIKLAPRQIFTPSKVRADVARIIELYKRQGRFAATVEPQMVRLDQNRVDVVFEIEEGPKSKVRQINIIGNEDFSDSELRGEMVTKDTGGLLSFLSSNTSYDPDRLAFDQQKLRLFYLTNGYADFRVVSAVAELTPDKRDFIITYVVEEGERYKFGDIQVESGIRDLNSDALTRSLTFGQGDWYNAKQVEDTVDGLQELAGTIGYAFAEVSPNFRPDRENLTMDVTFAINEAPRTYVERIDVNGNTLTQDKVIRREFRLAEGDAFNSLQVKRSTNRIKSLGYFQEDFEIEQKEGSAPDRIRLEANVQEKPTGQLQLSAGFSSIERFVFNGAIRQNNFRGRGQVIGLSAGVSSYQNNVQVSFAEPFLFDRNVSLGVDVYRRNLNNFNFINSNRNTSFEQTTTGGSLRLGFPLTEYVSLLGSYTLNYDEVTLDPDQYFLDLDGDGVRTCSPLLAGRYLCDALGNRLSSIVGLSLISDTLDNRQRPTRGVRSEVTLNVAGLGGSVKYLRLSTNTAKFWSLYKDFIFSMRVEGGFIAGLSERSGPGVDNVRLIDRFFLGQPEFRGFDIRGVGPRVVRAYYNADGTLPVIDLSNNNNTGIVNDPLGGKSYYLGRAELEIPLGSGIRQLGIRPSLFVDAGALFNITRPVLQDYPNGVQLRDTDGNPLFVNAAGESTIAPLANDGTANTAQILPGSRFREFYFGDSASPRVSVGFGVNWNSPFGPFRIDIAKVLRSQPGDDTKTVTFNVGTQF